MQHQLRAQRGAGGSRRSNCMQPKCCLRMHPLRNLEQLIVTFAATAEVAAFLCCSAAGFSFSKALAGAEMTKLPKMNLNVCSRSLQRLGLPTGIFNGSGVVKSLLLAKLQLRKQNMTFYSLSPLFPFNQVLFNHNLEPANRHSVAPAGILFG